MASGAATLSDLSDSREPYATNSDRQPAPPSDGSWRREVLHNALVILGLSGMAITQPLLDLFGKNAEYFVVGRLTRTEIIAVGLVAAFAVPAVLILVELALYRFRRTAGVVFHGAAVALLGAAFGGGIARHLTAQSSVVTGLLMVLSGALVLWGALRVPSANLVMRYLAVTPVLFLAVFLLSSASSRLVLFEREATAAGGVRVGTPAPIVILQMDELPLASLLTTDGRVNRDRFPNFARLADGSTWYRNALSVSGDTTQSVPSVVTGLIPRQGALPTSADYPESLFTLLGGLYAEDVLEPITDLCPPSVCEEAQTGTTSTERVRTALGDAAVVYGHLVLPEDLRASLPRVNDSWGGFLTGAAEPPAGRSSGSPGQSSGGDPFAQWGEASPEEQTPQGQAGSLGRWIARIGTDRAPHLSYAHTVLPHQPWVMTPAGGHHSDAGPIPGLDADGLWSADEFAVRQGQQRHLLQVGFIDTLLGRMMDQLQQTGIWEDAVVVVVADHGVAFTPGRNDRVAGAEETLHEIYNVPLFIKYPGQRAGRLDEGDARLIDVMPTIVDALDVSVSWQFDGRSLLPSDGVSADDSSAGPEVPSGVPVGFAGVQAVIERNRQRFPYGDDWAGVAAVGPYGDLVGRPVSELAVVGASPMTYVTYRPVSARDVTPVLQVGTIDLAGQAAPDVALMAVNGVVAGIAGGFSCHDGVCDYSGLLDEGRLDPGGDNRMELLVPSVLGGRRFQMVTPEG